MSVNFRGYLFQDDGDPVEGATVQLLDTGTTTVEDTFSGGTTSAGLWYFNEADQGKYDVKITSGSSVRYIRWNDQISIKELDVRNDTGEATPAATFSNIADGDDMEIVHFRGLRGTGVADDNMFFRYYMNDDGGNITEVARMTVNLVDAGAATEDSKIIWSIRSAGSDTLVDALTIASSSGGTTSMTLDVSGDLVLDADGGDIFFKDGGTTFGSATNTSGNLIIKSGTTTALTFSGANVTAAGTIGSGAITSTGIVTGTGFTAGNAVLAEAELELLDGLTAGTAIASKVVTTDANIDTSGQRNLTITGELAAATLDLSSSADIAGDLVLSGGADGALQFANPGENSIKIPDNQASALIIEEANNAYITFVTTNSSEAITVAKATTFSAGIANSGTIAAGTWNGTDVGVAYGGTGTSSLTDGGVLLGSGTSAVTAMAVLADSEMIVGDGTTDPVAESGATLRTSIGVGTGDSPQFTDLTLTDDLTLNSDSSVFNMGAGDDFTITHDGTTGATIAGNPLTLDSGADIVLDAEGGDIFFKDGGTTFGSATNTSGNLIIKSGTTTALTFSGANVTIAGDLTISGDDLTMGTNTSTAILVADGTNYNPVVPSGVIDLGNDGAFTLDNTVISSQTEITSGLAAADELLYSDGGTVKKIGLDNFVELAPTLATEDAIANGDYILFLDGGASGNMNKEAVHDLATLFAGSGLTATNSVIAVDTLNQDTSGTAAIATTVTITDNESTDEDNAIVFTAGGDVDGGNLGLESDGTLTYNPSTGKITATGFLGAIDGILGANSAAAITGTTIDATTDFTIGSTVITDASIVMTPSSSDTVTIAGATNGILNITTVDAAGTAADVNIDADGEIVIDAADAAGAIFKIAGTAQLSIIDGSILPTTDNDIDLGSSSYQFKDAYINGTLEADAITIGGTNVVTGSLVTTLGTISAGVWQGTAIASGYIAADAITGAKIADDAIDSEHYTNGSIDNAHIADDAIDSEHYADGSIDNAHIADDAIDSEHYAAGSIDTAHIADNQITLAKMAGLARGKLIYGDASGDPAALAVGSADQVLTHDGTDLAWADAGGGGATQIQAYVYAMSVGN